MKHTVQCVILAILVSLLSACSAPLTGARTGHHAGVESAPTLSTGDRAELSGIQKYEQEEAFLVQILGYYEKALAAHRDGDFDGAEALIDSAFVVYGKVDAGAIRDRTLVSRFSSAANSLVRELGSLIMESDQISRDTSESWVPELSDAELFKAGQWTDEELKSIVAQISRKCDIPIDYNYKVRGYISYFQNRGRRTMTTWLQRSGRYIPMIREVFAEENLPLDLAYLCFNESSLNPRAVSPARAAGLWQFLASTGSDYGLKRSEWVDERFDPVKSTCAAAKHLKRISGLYDDWNLVYAAYNWGEGRINRSVQAGVLDFWRMNLPRETENYVPINMAILAIAKAPEIFGFGDVVPDPPFEYETVEVRSGVKLKDAARCAGVSVEDIRRLNSELLRDCTPAGPDSYQLRIPKGKTGLFLAEYSKLPPDCFTIPSEPDQRTATTHKVRKGDTLASISRKYGVTVTALMQSNHLKKRSRLKSGQRLIIPGTSAPEGDIVADSAPDERPGPAKASKSSSSRKSVKRTNPSEAAPDTITYVVKRHDSLSAIAARYGVSHRDLMRWNKIESPRKVATGTRLVIKTNR